MLVSLIRATSWYHAHTEGGWGNFHSLTISLRLIISTWMNPMNPTSIIGSQRFGATFAPNVYNKRLRIWIYSHDWLAGKLYSWQRSAKGFRVLLLYKSPTVLMPQSNQTLHINEELLMQSLGFNHKLDKVFRYGLKSNCADTLSHTHFRCAIIGCNLYSPDRTVER